MFFLIDRMRNGPFVFNVVYFLDASFWFDGLY